MEATEKAEGVKTYTCTVCNATKTETIAKLVSSKNNNSDKENAQENPVFAQTNATSPKTGDSTNMFAWVLLMIVSAGAITVSILRREQQDNYLEKSENIIKGIFSLYVTGYLFLHF